MSSDQSKQQQKFQWLDESSASESAEPAEDGPVNDPPDQPQREMILNSLDETLLVEAAAGTGKTTCLIGRMVNLLRTGRCEVSTLAAITFTRKAAAELRTRFQLALEQAQAEASATELSRLQSAIENVQQCFIGTIHSFCSRLLRERPFEAGVDPNFTELDDQQDRELRRHVWREYVSGLVANNDPILPELEAIGLQVTAETNRTGSIANELDEIGLEPAELGPAFLDFAKYPDVESWPTWKVPLPDFGRVRVAVREYLEHMETFEFPVDRGTDQLMNRYEAVVRKASLIDLEQPAELMQLMELFKNTKVTLKCWPDKTGRAERDRWEQFLEDVAEPARQAWAEFRYEPCMRAIQPVRELYRDARLSANTLNFQDLLQLSTAVLRDRPEIREYFRSRFTHLLIDEFQDTDPIQAEMMLLLTADDASETEWQKCRPVPGSLFVVGDPKQSIYRFRRADIQTYNKVRDIIVEGCGQVVPLTANFRSSESVIRFVNSSFAATFPAVEDEFSPANRELDAVRPAPADGDTIQILRVPTDRGWPNIRAEARLIARTIRAAIDGASGWKIPRKPGELKAGLTDRPVPADFLIIAPKTKHLSTYGAELQRFGISHVVTGGESLSDLPELRLLHLVTAAVTRPDDPIALVAVLRSALFGISDTALYDFKLARGRFSWAAPLPEELGPELMTQFSEPYRRLKQYAAWLSRYRIGPAIEKIADDLGLIAQAAAANDGGMRAGSLMKALELVRGTENAFSTGDFIAALEQLVNGSQGHGGITARSPVEAPARVMNLHQCKGLEAPVVFLVNPTRQQEYPIGIHIDRSGSETHGFLPVYGAQVHERTRQRHLLARPQNWTASSDRERRFLNAEEDRLRYVAATRAEVRLIISQRDGKNDGSFWEAFDDDLADKPLLPDPGDVAPPHAVPQPIDSARHAESLQEIPGRWATCMKSTYDVQAIKELALKGPKPAYGTAVQGKEWGTVLHTLLEAAMKHSDSDLKPLAVSSLTEEGLSLDMLDEVIATVKRVMASDMWKRAQASEHCLVEVPIQTLSSDSQLPTILRGVIDLVFREPSGWVIVDYKSERVPADTLEELTKYYRPQLEAYAQRWQELTGETVSEQGVFYTHFGHYVKL